MSRKSNQCTTVIAIMTEDIEPYFLLIGPAICNKPCLNCLQFSASSIVYHTTAQTSSSPTQNTMLSLVCTDHIVISRLQLGQIQTIFHRPLNSNLFDAAEKKWEIEAWENYLKIKEIQLKLARQTILTTRDKD